MTKAYVLIEVLTIFSIILTLVTKSFGQQNPAGYISIDCGSDGPSTDSQTNLLWVDDERYTLLGKNGLIQNPDWVNATSYNVENQTGYYYPGNFKALQTFRYFPRDQIRSKYCYELPLTTSNISFLLRAMFLHGNASVLKLPIDFTIYVNDTYWVAVTYTEFEDPDLYSSWISQESIFFSPGGITNVCLVPKQGVPFISSLELRELDSEGRMYAQSFAGRTDELYFTTLGRWTFGPDQGDTTIRYPYDRYDRLWVPSQVPRLAGTNQYSLQLGIGENSGMFVNATHAIPEHLLGPDMNSVPVNVMNAGWTSVNTPSGYNNLLEFIVEEYPVLYTGSFTSCVLYCSILNESTFGNRTYVDIEADGIDLGTFEITTRPSQNTLFHILSTNYTNYYFNGNLSISAFEYFQLNGFIPLTTYSDDVRVVNLIKKVLNLTTWQGDPCVPVPYDWLGCGLDYKSGSQLSVENLTISNLEIGSRTIEELNNGESGWELTSLSITNSKITSETFRLLFEHFIDIVSLFTVNMSYNDISMLPDAQWWIQAANGSQYVPPYSFDFSYNQLTQLPRIVDLPVSNLTISLNISNNKISSEFLAFPSFSNLPNLQVLNIASNGMEGEIPQSLSRQHLSSIEILDISNNSFGGTFPSSFFIMNTSNSFELNADNNQFENTLDLTAWYQNLNTLSKDLEIHDLSNSTRGGPDFNQSFSLLNNKISNIRPSAKEFGPLIESFINIQKFNQSGILLSGNPYCEGAKDFVQRYLCRSSTSDVVYHSLSGGFKIKNIVIISVGPATALAAIGIMVGILLCRSEREKKRKRLLKEAHMSRMEFLLDMHRKGGAVVCKLFTLEELKKITSDFKEENVIGVGGFGKIHKGTLDDGTEVAVKSVLSGVNGGTPNDLKQFINEVTILSAVNHQNLVKLLGCCLETQIPILVYEFVSNGSLQHHLLQAKCPCVVDTEGVTEGLVQANPPLDWDQRLSIAIGSAAALSYLHSGTSPPIYHRDVKSANILLDKNFKAKVADFGISKAAPLDEEEDSNLTAIQGTLGYLDPKYVASGQMTAKSDVYSFGVVLLELLTGEQAIDRSRSEPDQNLGLRCKRLIKFELFEEAIDPSLNASSDTKKLEAILEVAKLAMECLATQLENRPTMRQAEDKLRSLCPDQTTSRKSRASESTSSRSSSAAEEDMIMMEPWMGSFYSDDIHPSSSFLSGTLTDSESHSYNSKSFSSTKEIQMLPSYRP